MCKAVIVDPILDLDQYVEHLYRKQKIKNIMTGFQESEFDDKYENIGGYKTQKTFLKQLQDYGWVDLDICNRFSVSIVSNSDIAKDKEGLNRSVLKYGPFWERIPPQNNSQLISKIIEEIDLK